MQNLLKQKWAYITALAALIMVSGCESDVELNADYKSTTVIFGLLDADASGDGLNNQLDTQWIKINRTWLGDGDNYTYAQIRDSSEYKNEEIISAKVVRYFDGNALEEWNLTPVTVSNKDINGIFYEPEQTLYYFVPPVAGLHQESNYRLEIDFAGKEDVYAETDLIRSSQLSFYQPQPPGTVSLATGSASAVAYTQGSRIKWYAAPGAKSYDVKIRFHFKEKLYDNPQHTGTPVVTDKFADFNAGSYKVEDANEDGQLEVEFNGEPFYTMLESTLEANPNIVREIGFFDGSDTRCFDVIISMGNDNFNTYIEVNSPVSGIVQERPTFSNIGNGLGLFASRSTRTLRNLTVVTSGTGVPNLGNLHGLCAPVLNSHTLLLNFCDPNPTSNYACD
ncbi:MAG: hypothetical protein ACKVOR_06350 [Flavobacteriales bacterium]